MLSANSMQYLNQLGGLLTFVDIEDTGRAVAYKMVPCSHWHQSNQFPHEVQKELRAQTFRTTKVEGLEYYLIPETTTNAVGTVTQYVQPEPSPVPVDTKAPPAAAKYLKRAKVVDTN